LASPLTSQDARRGGQPALPAAERHRRRRDWLIAAVIATLLGALVALQPELLLSSRWLPIGSDALLLALLNANVLLIGLLVFLLGRNVVKLVVERRRRIFGARLNTRFVLSFLLVTGVSSIVLFAASGYLLLRVVSAWFELEVVDGLGESISLAQAYHEDQQETALHSARQIAQRIARLRLLRAEGLPRLQLLLEEKRAEHSLARVEVFSAGRRQLASAAQSDQTVVSLESPESELVRAGLQGIEQARVVDAPGGELVRAEVPIYATGPPGQDPVVLGVVVVNRFVPLAIRERVKSIEAVLAAYKRLQPSEGALQASTLAYLSIVALASLLFSTWIGFRLAKQISEPIGRLASAATQVAAGNLDVQLEPGVDDEIGALVAEFNRMASDLRSSRQDLDRRRVQLEVIVGSVAAGVISLDQDLVIQTINPSARELLGMGSAEGQARKVDEVLHGEPLHALTLLLRRLAVASEETVRRQAQIAVGDELRTLNWTASRIHEPGGEARGFVVVIDDVTQILRAQRMSAWREVARRIAHEIKNPLTPIQLSAQRLQRKLADRVTDAEALQVLRESTSAIMGQVDAMKHLLAEFSRFARLPATDPAPADLNALVTEIVDLYRGDASIEFLTQLAPDLPVLDLDQEQIKRVILNLLDNAVAAIDEAGPGPRVVRVSTRYERELATVTLEVADTGIGVAPEDRLRLFEPYYSTKRQGSGLGLAIVSRIVSDHSGYIRVRANQPRGTCFSVELPART
jgi:two-component system nitrogen regulation sensor histidine kinase NtrY